MFGKVATTYHLKVLDDLPPFCRPNSQERAANGDMARDAGSASMPVTRYIGGRDKAVRRGTDFKSVGPALRPGRWVRGPYAILSPRAQPSRWHDVHEPSTSGLTAHPYTDSVRERRGAPKRSPSGAAILGASLATTQVDLVSEHVGGGLELSGPSASSCAHPLSVGGLQHGFDELREALLRSLHCVGDS